MSLFYLSSMFTFCHRYLFSLTLGGAMGAFTPQNIFFPQIAPQNNEKCVKIRPDLTILA